MAGAAQDEAADLRMRRQLGGQHPVELGEPAGGVEVGAGEVQALRATARRGLVAVTGREPDVVGSLFDVQQIPFFC